MPQVVLGHEKVGRNAKSHVLNSGMRVCPFQVQLWPNLSNKGIQSLTEDNNEQGVQMQHKRSSSFISIVG